MRERVEKNTRPQDWREEVWTARTFEDNSVGGDQIMGCPPGEGVRVSWAGVRSQVGCAKASVNYMEQIRTLSIPPEWQARPCFPLLGT